MLMAGLDGIQNKIEPHAPVDKDLYELSGAEAAAIPQVPSSLPAVLEALEADNAPLQYSIKHNAYFGTVSLQ